MIRRLLAATVLVLGFGIVAAPVAAAAVPTSINTAGSDIFCLYNLKPTNLGLCISV